MHNTDNYNRSSKDLYNILYNKWKHLVFSNVIYVKTYDNIKYESINEIKKHKITKKEFNKLSDDYAEKYTYSTSKKFYGLAYSKNVNIKFTNESYQEIDVTSKNPTFDFKKEKLKNLPKPNRYINICGKNCFMRGDLICGIINKDKYDNLYYEKWFTCSPEFRNFVHYLRMNDVKSLNVCKNLSTFNFIDQLKISNNNPIYYSNCQNYLTKWIRKTEKASSVYSYIYISLFVFIFFNINNINIFLKDNKLNSKKLLPKKWILNYK